MQFVKPLTTSVALFLVFAIAFVGCNSSRFPSGELVMFTSIGPHVFQGRVSVVRPDGSSVTTVLNPNASLEYSAAFGNSLKTFIVASAAQSIGGNNFVTNLVQYFPSSGRTIPLQQQLPAGQEGVGVPSPDNSQFVAE